MTEVGQRPLRSFRALCDLGHPTASFPHSALPLSMNAPEEFLRSLKKTGTQSDWLDRMQTRKELYDLLEYDPAAESWPGYDRNHRTPDGRPRTLNGLA